MAHTPDNRQVAFWRRIFRKWVIGAALVVSAILILEHKPNGYCAVTLDEQGLEQVRRSLANRTDEVSELMVAGKPFQMVVGHGEVNEWIAAILHHRPELRRELPGTLSQFCISFASGGVRIASIYDSSGWRAVISATGDWAVQADTLTFTFRRAYVGSLPLPHWVANRLFVRPLASALGRRYSCVGNGAWKLTDDAEAMLDDHGYVQIRVRNRLTWPNGKRPFRIEEIRSEFGKLHMGVQPLGT